MSQLEDPHHDACEDRHRCAGVALNFGVWWFGIAGVVAAGLAFGHLPGLDGGTATAILPGEHCEMER